MNPEEIQHWKEDVNHHLETLEMMVNDRKTLKNLIEAHLKLCFNWDNIEYNKDFSVITLKWKRNVNPIIKAENIKKLLFDWEISADYDDEAFKIVVVKVYPWGVYNSP